MSTIISKQMQIGTSGTATDNFTIRQPATPDGTVRIANGNSGTTTDLVTVTSAGNFGLGVTPSAWASGNKFIDVNASASYGAFGSTDSMMLANAYWSGSNWIRKNANNAWRMVMESTSGGPSYTFQYAANGTAGSTISWSEAMRITSSGNVGIGTSSPSQKLTIADTNKAVDSRGNAYIFTTDTATSGSGAQLTLGGSYTGTTDAPFAGISGRFEGGLNGYLSFLTLSSGAMGERARINSSGNLLVGTTSGTGGRIVSESNLFDESNTNAWKNGAFNGRGSFGGPLAFVNTGGASDGFAFYLTGNPSQLNIRFGANAGAVSAGVYMTSTATSWTAQSDERLKNITGTITDAVQSVKSLRPVRYTLKADQDKTHRVGLIAQDVQKVLPEVVDTDAKGYLGVRYSEIVPLLVAAIQEQQAIITALNVRVAALESN
jgi:hypothetical protein